MFVDDDPALLASLRRQMRELRKEYSLAFASDGRDALAQIDDNPVDLIISDMRMPNMDGAQLLTHMAQRNPDTMRIILSGQAESQQLFTALGIAHLILSKPCKAETLKNIIRRCHSMKESCNREDVRKFAVQRDQWTGSEETVQNLMRLFRQTDVSVQSVAEAISRDIVVSARVLGMVNSAFFGLSHQVSDIRQAVVLLGLPTIKAIYLNLSLSKSFETSSLAAKLASQCMNRGLKISKLALANLGERGANPEWQDDCLMASVLTDIGMPIMASYAEDEYKDVLAKAGNDHDALIRYEQESFGCDHAEVGAYQLSLWGFDPRIIEAVLNHGRGVEAQIYTIGSAVYDANSSLARELQEAN